MADTLKGRRKRGKNWISGAVKHPGAATAAAKAEGESLGEWISEHEDEGGVSGKRARLAKTFRKMGRKRRGA